MEIRIGKEWVIQSSGNAMNIILAKVPQDLQDSTDPIDPIRLSQKFYYSTIFGAITGVFKLGIADSEARTFQDLEKDIHRIAKECQKAFDAAKEPSHGGDDMTDLNKEREAFLNTFQYYKGRRDIIFSNEHELFMTRSNNPSEIAQKEISNMNRRWDAWLRCAKHRDAELEKAKAQAVQQSFEIGRLQDRITELLDERQDLYAQINNDQAVPDTQQKLTDTYYLEGSDYVVDCPFEYDIEIDKGEVLELQKWQRTDSTKVYFANIYKDEDNFEILQFASKAEAENAVAENLKFLEASESGAEK